MTYTNDTKDVSITKGVAGGYGFSAPIGTALPTGYASTLDAAFENMGFISDSGIEESVSTDTSEHADMNGDVICVSKDKETEDVKLTLVSITKAALSEMHGHDAVTETDNEIIIKHQNVARAARSYVFLLLLKDGRKWTKVIPNGTVKEVGSISMVSSSLYGREITIGCAPDAEGNRVYDYIQKAAGEAAEPDGE